MMSTDPATAPTHNPRPYRIVDLNYASVYVKDFADAIAFYSRVYGPPDSVDQDKAIYGWRLRATWFTVFASRAGTCPDSNPRNAEYAVQVAAVEEVDELYGALLAAGAKAYMPPADTRMYEPMRFACVDDPFGVRIDVYCRLGQRSA